MTQKAARRKGALPLADIEASAFDALLTHPVCKEAVQKQIDAAIDESAIRQSFAGVWGRLSSPSVVGSTHGFPLRRALGAAIAGPGVTFKKAREFSGGALKQPAFIDAQKRRADFLSGGNNAELL